MLAFLVTLTICSSSPRIDCIHDGDTFWHKGEKVRISDIDTPELNGKCSYEKRLAIKARDRLEEILREPYQIHREGKDRYGRTLAVVTVNGRSVGNQLVSEGLARTWTGRRKTWC